MRKRIHDNSAKCEGCKYCTIQNEHGAELVYCKDRDRKWLFGQHIEPCHYYEKGVLKHENH